MINNVAVQNLYVVQADCLNIRSGAGINYPITGGIRKNELVNVRYSVNGFSCIGDNKWVCSKYIKKYTDDICWKATTMYDMNMRKGPGTEYDKIGLIPKGTTVKVLKEENNWFEVKYGKKVFWLSGAYLK